VTPVSRFGVLALALLLLWGGLSYWQRDSMLSPGHLLEGHTEIHGSCFQCHSPFRGVETGRCVACHPLEEIGFRTVSGVALPGSERASFHQALREGACAACHTDHAGPDAEGTLRQFEHGLLLVSVVEVCTGCHEKQRPGDTLHTGVKAGCGPCHQTSAWTPASFDHEPYFRFDRHHPDDCGTCHTTEGDLAAYTCYGCHEHTPRNVRSEHLEEGIREFEACEDCHRSADEEEAERAWKKMRRKEKRRSSPASRRSERRHHDDDDDDDDDRDEHRDHEDDD
jgi:predicted CXXCH cytochrome family protein